MHIYIYNIYISLSLSLSLSLYIYIHIGVIVYVYMYVYHDSFLTYIMLLSEPSLRVRDDATARSSNTTTIVPKYISVTNHIQIRQSEPII